MSDQEREERLIALVYENRQMMGALADLIEANRLTMRAMLELVDSLTARDDLDEAGDRQPSQSTH